MPVTHGSYNFDAADNLESLLYKASGTLQNFMAKRATWAQQNFTYQPAKPQHCWVGTEYDKWAGQFNYSQGRLAGYVDQLNRLKAAVHNASYTAARGLYNTTDRMPQSAIPGPSSAAFLTPSNTDPYNAEAATPNLLKDYSKNATSLNDTICPFYSRTLMSATDSYQPRPSTIGPNGDPNLTPVIVGLNDSSPFPVANSIAIFLSRSVLELDARAGIVGAAFEAADSQPIPNNGHVPQGDDPRASQFVSISSGELGASIEQIVKQDGALQKYEQNYNAGKAAAESVNSSIQGDGRMPQDVYNEIQRNLNNPEWLAGFFNSLSKTSLYALLDVPSAPLPLTPTAASPVLRGLMAAYSSGDVTNQTSNWLMQYMANPLKNPSAPGSLTSAFILELADPKNVQAAQNFVFGLDQQSMSLLISTPFDWTGGKTPPQNSVFSVLFMNIARHIESPDGDPTMLGPFVSGVGMALAGMQVDSGPTGVFSINAAATLQPMSDFLG